MLHILPENFYKTRYYGILSSRNKQKDIAKCREILGVAKNKKPKKAEIVQPCSDRELPNKEISVGYNQCPNCKAGTMHSIKINIRAA